MKIKTIRRGKMPRELRELLGIPSATEVNIVTERDRRNPNIPKDESHIRRNFHYSDAQINRISEKQNKKLINKKMRLAKTTDNIYYIASEINEGFPEPGILRVGVHNTYGLTIRPANAPLYTKEEQEDNDYDDIEEKNFSDKKEEVKSYFHLENYCTSLKEFEDDISVFLNKREFYDKYEIAYKRSYLLFGDTGTGKTQKIFNTARKLISDRGAYVIEIKDFDDAHAVLGYDDKIGEIFTDKFLVFWVEELYNLTRGDDDRIAVLLNLLDNKHLSRNIIWLITTNHPEGLPANLVDRPSRIDRLIEVNPAQYQPGLLEAWYHFLYGDQPDFTGMTDAEMKDAKKLSIAYLKEWFVYSRLNEMTLAEGYKRIVARKKLIKDNFKSNTKGMGFI